MRRDAMGLTQRQRQIVILLSRGLAKKQIARRLFISPNTVNRTIQAVFDETGVHDRLMLARWWLARRWRARRRRRREQKQ